MREIKFRAWSNDRQTMLQIGDGFGTTHGLDCVVYARHGQNVELMQYTGLKDMNDVEIYEGDIVRRSKSFGVIAYVEDGFEIDWKIDVDFWSQTLKYHAEHLKVIGNIYENTDLLTNTASK